MNVYIVTVVDGNSVGLTGVFATRALANAEVVRLITNNPDVLLTVTEADVVGSPEQEMPEHSPESSWEGHVDRQGGSFDEQEIVDHYGWR